MHHVQDVHNVHEALCISDTTGVRVDMMTFYFLLFFFQIFFPPNHADLEGNKSRRCLTLSWALRTKLSRPENTYRNGIRRGWVKSFPKYCFFFILFQVFQHFKNTFFLFLALLNPSEMFTSRFDAPIWFVKADYSNKYNINNNINFPFQTQRIWGIFWSRSFQTHRLSEVSSGWWCSHIFFIYAQNQRLFENSASVLCVFFFMMFLPN